MEKRHERESRLKEAKDADARKAQEDEFRQMQEKHKKHERPHHPMTKDQLEEVSERLPACAKLHSISFLIAAFFQIWEDKDNMRPEDFDPKTFFAFHDLNGDGVWDQDEVKVSSLEVLPCPLQSYLASTLPSIRRIGASMAIHVSM